MEGFILIGGASSRMGTDKSRLVLGGRTFMEQIAGAMSAVAPRITLVGKQVAGSELGCAPDIFKDWGALGGLHAALAACREEWALIVACDLPFVTSSLFKQLADLRLDFDAVVPKQPNGYLQPLCAMYRVASCLNVCEQLIKAGERRPSTLIDSVKTRVVPFEDLSYLVGADHFFDNINTPQDYDRAKEERKGDDASARG